MNSILLIQILLYHGVVFSRFVPEAQNEPTIVSWSNKEYIVYPDLYKIRINAKHTPAIDNDHAIDLQTAKTDESGSSSRKVNKLHNYVTIDCKDTFNDKIISSDSNHLITPVHSDEKDSVNAAHDANKNLIKDITDDSHHDLRPIDSDAHHSVTDTNDNSNHSKHEAKTNYTTEAVSDSDDSISKSFHLNEKELKEFEKNIMNDFENILNKVLHNKTNQKGDKGNSKGLNKQEIRSYLDELKESINDMLKAYNHVDDTVRSQVGNDEPEVQLPNNQTVDVNREKRIGDVIQEKIAVNLDHYFQEHDANVNNNVNEPTNEVNADPNADNASVSKKCYCGTVGGHKNYEDHNAQFSPASVANEDYPDKLKVNLFSANSIRKNNVLNLFVLKVDPKESFEIKLNNKNEKHPNFGEEVVGGGNKGNNNENSDKEINKTPEEFTDISDKTDLKLPGDNKEQELINDDNSKE
ncbi:uncharacterized protein DDB_G0287625-like [Bombyx mandarina]|uniref:Uncharacterized protein DDB_G0287625-like n=1 Tax=Bombyx mandarina TaxID=7092 RepID=A0A6J2K3M6_BOMMA|nr:uncharacterized protein DDB_G0287625-like [Bombyx mandarina]